MTTARIRAFLQEGNTGTPTLIADALGMDRHKTAQALSLMFRQGFATRTNGVYGMGNLPTQKLPEEELKQRARERRMRRYYAKGGRTMAQRRSDEAAAREARKLAPKVTRPAKVQPTVQKRRFDTPIEPRKPSVIEVAPAKPRLMSSDEWIARGGKVQVLPSQLGQAYAGLNSALVSLY